MKEKEKIALKTRLKRLGYHDSKIKIILSIDDNLLKKLYLISSNKSLCESVDTIFNLYTEMHEDNDIYLKNLAEYKNRYSPEDYEEGVNLLTSLHGYKKKLAYQVLINEDLMNTEKNIESVRILLMAHDEMHATFVTNVLTNRELILLNVSLEVASILVEPYSFANIEELRGKLDTPEKEQLFKNTLKTFQNSLRVFISSPEKDIRYASKDLDDTLKDIKVFIMNDDLIKTNSK